MGFETLKNIIDYNKEQANLHYEDEELENNVCPYCAWPLSVNSKNERDCPMCERIWRV